jgi:glycosyltransferase involved in cell wall biosynthesis
VRIALVGPVYPYRGGIAHYTTMLCQALRERGHDVLPISFMRQYPKWLFPGRSDKDPSAEPLEVEGAKYWIDSLNPITWVTTSWHVRRYQPDAVILQWWTTFWAPIWLALALTTKLVLHRPLIFICHNVLPHETRWWDPGLTRLVLRWGTDFVVQSEREKSRLLALLPKADIDVVPHPVYDMFANQKIPRREARERLGLPPERPILLFFGIVREYKGLRDILAALPAVEAQLGKVMLVVAGEIWEDKRDYVEMIDQLGIGDSVIMEDRYIPNEEVPVYFAAADVLVAPYRQATGSGAVQMALGCGRPVITTSVGDLAHIVREADAGCVTEPANRSALAECIIDYFERQEGLPARRARTESRCPSRWERLVTVIEGAARECESSSC